ncbi:MAG: tRNA (adenosine(37)-N6)-dimethylallyltransferase MiaA [Anaplasma sp.]
MNKLLVITGPTSSGKSRVSRMAVERLSCVVVNCDSKQVYRGVPTITDQEEFLRADPRFKLYGYVHPSRNYSVALWLEDAKKQIIRAWSEDLLPIVVGGSGLYVNSLVYGLAEIPEIDPNVRCEAETLLNTIGIDKFYKLLLQRDPNASRIDRHNPSRLLRAFEVIEGTGTSIFTWVERCPRRQIFDNCRICVLSPPREELYPKINQRIVYMVNSSALAEVEYLMSLNLPDRAPVMQATGVPELMEYLKGNVSLPEAVATAQKNTRLYAKRQYTWFRRQLPSDAIFCSTQEDLLERVASYFYE